MILDIIGYIKKMTKKMILVFFLSLLPFAFIYSQSEAGLDCNLNLENIFKVYDHSIKYETVRYIYKRNEKEGRFTKNDVFLNGYFKLIRGYPLYPEKQNDSISGVNSGELGKLVSVEWMSKEEMDRYIEQLDYPPEQALKEYKDCIRNIQSEKEAYLKCIDAELAKGDLSEYAKKNIIPYGFKPPESSIMPLPTRLSKLDFLKVFKEFIFNKNETVLPEGQRIIRYLSRFTDADIIALSQNTAANAVKLLYERIKDFDRECFLIGALDDNIGHYQTFTANRSVDDIDDSVKWMFEKVFKFMPDTMAHQRITTYGNDLWTINLALITVSLFKKDYPDIRALRVCTCTRCYPSRKYYGSEVKSHYDPEDSICRKVFEIELYSSSLAKVIAGYYDFDYEKRLLPVISSGGDVGYRGIINKKKISTQAQKLSFLAGVFMRYGCSNTVNGFSGYHKIPVFNSLSLATVCSAILKETGCEHVVYIDNIDNNRTPVRQKILFTPSSEVWNLENVIHDVRIAMNGCYLR
jgi:hypothetical protein